MRISIRAVRGIEGLSQWVSVIFCFALLLAATSCARIPEWKKDTILAQESFQNNDFGQAEAYLKSAVKKASGIRGPKTLLCDQLRKLGQYYISRQNTSEDRARAGELFLYQLSVLDQDPAAPKPELIRCLYQLANLHMSGPESQEIALPKLKRLIKLNEIEPTLTEIEMAEALQAVGTCYMGEGSYDKAIDMLTRALSIKNSLRGSKNDGSTITGTTFLGLAYERSGQYEKAVGSYEDALKLLRQTPENTFQSYGTTRNHGLLICLESLSRTYIAMGRIDDADKVDAEIEVLKSQKPAGP